MILDTLTDSALLEAFAGPFRPRLAEALAALADLPLARAQELVRNRGIGRDAAGNLRICEASDPLWGDYLPESIASVDEAWEMFATRGFFSERWLDNTDRSFMGTSRPSRHRPCMQHLALFAASDAAAMETAEGYVREFEARLAPWGHKSTGQFSWEHTPYYGSSVPLVYCEAFRQAFSYGHNGWDEIERYRWLSDRDRARARDALANLARYAGSDGAAIVRHARAALAWEQQVHEEYAVEEGPLEDTPFAELPNPFAPLLDLWRTGYRFVGFTTAGLAVLRYPDYFVWRP